MKKTSGKIALIAMVFLCVNFKNDLYAFRQTTGAIKKDPIPLKTDGKFVVSEDMVKCTQWEEFNEIKDSKLYRPNGYIEGSVDPYIEADECIEGVLGGTDTKSYENSLLIESDGTYDKNQKVLKTTNQKMPEVFCSKKYSKIHYGQPYEFVCADGEASRICSDFDVKINNCKKGEKFCRICVSKSCTQNCSHSAGSGHGDGGSGSCITTCTCNRYDTTLYTKSVKFNSKRCVKWELAYPIGKATIDPNNIEF